MRQTHILHWISLLALAGMVMSAAKLKGCCTWNNKYMKTNSKMTKLTDVNKCSAFCTNSPHFGISRSKNQCFCFENLDEQQSVAKTDNCWRNSKPQRWKRVLLAIYEIEKPTIIKKPNVVTRPTFRTTPGKKNTKFRMKKVTTTIPTTTTPYKNKITSMKRLQTLTTKGAIPLKTTVRTSKADLLRSTIKVEPISLNLSAKTAIPAVPTTDFIISTTQPSNTSVSAQSTNYELTDDNRTQQSEKIRENMSVHGVDAELDMSNSGVAKVSQNDEETDKLVVPVAAGVSGGLVLILALIVGLVIGHRRHNIFRKKPAKSSTTPKRYNNPSYSTQETFNSEIGSVQATVIGLPVDETDVYYSQVPNTTSVERVVSDIDKQQESLYYEAETVYENSTAEASYPPRHPGAYMGSDYEGTDIYCLAEEIKDDLVVVDNDLYGT